MAANVAMAVFAIIGVSAGVAAPRWPQQVADLFRVALGILVRRLIHGYARASLTGWVSAIATGAQGLLDDYGLDGYKKIRDLHPLPIAELRRLQQQLTGREP